MQARMESAETARQKLNEQVVALRASLNHVLEPSALRTGQFDDATNRAIDEIVGDNSPLREKPSLIYRTIRKALAGECEPCMSRAVVAEAGAEDFVREVAMAVGIENAEPRAVVGAVLRHLRRLSELELAFEQIRRAYGVAAGADAARVARHVVAAAGVGAGLVQERDEFRRKARELRTELSRVRLREETA